EPNSYPVCWSRTKVRSFHRSITEDVYKP
ncbi:transport protein Sec61 alpha subunit, partial [Danaus plexippus plexippus]